MKDTEQIHELLNCYMDGQLDERKNNEVRRLIDNDDSVRGLYESLKKSRILIASIPDASAPDELLDGIRTQLERQMLLEGAQEGSYKAGKAHLVMRRIMTVAAVLVLVSALSFIVFDVFVPSSSRKQMMASFSKKPEKQILYERPFADAKPVVDRKVVAEFSPSVPLIARLVFNTPAPILADTLVGKSIMNQNLFANTSSIDRRGNSITYILDCDKSQIVALMGEMEMLWTKCREVSLSLGTKNFGSYVDIGNLSAADAIEIINIDDYGRRMRMAGDIAKINSVSVPDVISELYADSLDDIDYDFAAPKPILTSAAEPNKPTVRVSSDSSTLTIIIVNR